MTSEDTRLNDVLDRMLDSHLRHSPETATRLGLDTGTNAALRHRLDERSVAASERFTNEQAALLKELHALDRSRLQGMAAHNFDTVVYQRDALVAAARRFPYGTGDSEPYVLSPMTGAYQSVPDFLENRHPVEDEEDAHAYLARLTAFAEVLDHETERVHADAARGVLPPDFVLDTTLAQLQSLRDADPKGSGWVASLARRTGAKGLRGAWDDCALEIVQQRIHPALERQVQLLQRWRGRATHEAGVWRLPDGEAYYEQAIRLHTSTGMSADDVHRLGLEQVAALLAQMDALLQAQGLGAGTVGERLAALGRDARFIYPNTDDGRARLLADLDAKVHGVQARLPHFFERLPKAALEVRRVPPGIQAGAPRGYYQAGSLDGSQPGAFYVNLRNTAEWTRWYLPTFAFHEGVPGHHLQGSLALEADGVATLRKALWFAGYGEGWALYAEQLADEMGAYEGDPFGRLGYLQSMLFRAARLVVDTGMHAKRWSFEQAVQYMVDTLGETRSRINAEVARYCVVPGQALSYKVGHSRWVALRESARRQLGPRFDLRRFHTAALMAGALPLDVLDRVIAAWIAESSHTAPGPRPH